MAKVQKNKKFKIDKAIMILFIIVIFIAGFVIFNSNKAINHYMDIIQENIKRRLIVESEAVSNMVTAEELKEYVISEDMNKESYKELQKKVQLYAEKNDLKFVYFLRLVNNKIQYIVDSDKNPETHSDLNDFEEPYWLVLDAYKERKAVVNILGDYQQGWEGLISAYTPVFDETGSIIALAGIDISDEEIIKREKEVKLLTIASGIVSITLVLISFVVIIRYRKKVNDARVAIIAKAEFLSRIGHEIRTPMNAIIGFCRMAKNTNEISKKDKYLDDISDSSEALMNLILAILDISNLEAKKLELSIKRESFGEIIKNIEAVLATQIIKKNINFDLELSNDIPKYVFCDKARLTQIIVNLAYNAIKFAPENGDVLIKISSIKKNDKTCNLEFIIKDNGIGIEEKNLRKVFEPFEQGDGSLTRKFSGTGLGLTISKQFIELMNGEISVQSKVNEGSTFKFNIWLDIAPDDTPLVSSSTNEKETMDTIDCSGMTFLVAEDSLVNQMIVKDLLEGFGATVEFANDGKECIEKYTTNPEKYNLIFMDIQMPEIDGLEATKRIRESGIENASSIPIVAMTAEVQQEDIKRSLETGMNDHLGKPLNIKQIIEVMKKVLNK